ncbi:MAG: Sec-independent protein translocase protein TatB [Paracoccaceae bacterium]
MFNLGWTEILLIGVIALVVIGPKDLPEVFRQIGRFSAKLRSMSRDFQRAMEEAAKDSGVNDVVKDLKTATSAKSLGLTAVKDAADKFEKWDPLKPVKAKPATTAAAKPASAENKAASNGADQSGAAEAPAAKAEMGPATKALAEKMAAKRSVLSEAAEKLKEINKQGATPQAAEAAPAVKAATATKSKTAAKPKTAAKSKAVANAPAKAPAKATAKTPAKVAAKPAPKTGAAPARSKSKAAKA